MNKKQKVEKCRAILKAHKPGDFILNLDDNEFLDDLLTDHKYYEQKIDGQEYEIYVDIAKGYNTKCFNLKREDGTTTDFSFYECIYPTKTDRADFVKASRKAITEDMMKFKNNFFSKMIKRRCPVCGIHIVESISHVDHHPIKFRDLISSFIKENTIKDFANYLPNYNHYDNIIGVEFADNQIKQEWINYHNKNAKLRVICSSCNLKLH